MGALLSLLFPDQGFSDGDHLEVYDYGPRDLKELDQSQGEWFLNDLVMIHPSIPRLSWIGVVGKEAPKPEGYLRVIPLSVYTYSSEPSLDPELYDRLCDLGDTVLEDNRLYILVPDFRPSILEALGLSFLSPWTYNEEQVVQTLTYAYECLLNAVIETTYTRIRLPPFSLDYGGPWSSNPEEPEEMARFTAKALATACSKERLGLLREKRQRFELVLGPKEKDVFSKMIKALT